MGLDESLLSCALGNLIQRTSQGQSLKLTISSSHCEPLSGFNNCGCDLLTCLIPSGGSPIFKAIRGSKQLFAVPVHQRHLPQQSAAPNGLRPHQTMPQCPRGWHTEEEWI